MTCRLLSMVSALLAVAGCVQQPNAPMTQAPTMDVVERLDRRAAPSVRVDAEEADAEALLVASAMSYLGKTAAEFDGVTMVEVEHDPELLLEEAFADPGFCALVAEADTDPHDGVLTTVEATRLEHAVLATVEG